MANPEETPIVIDLDNNLYIDEFEKVVESFSSFDELYKILHKHGCSSHSEPVIHASAVVVVKNGYRYLIEGDFFSGIPIREIVNFLMSIALH